MDIFESVSKSFLQVDNKGTKNPSNVTSDDNVDSTLYDPYSYVNIGFFDDEDNRHSYNGSVSEKSKALHEQNIRIEKYRKIEEVPEVNNAIDEIVDEMVFNPNNEESVITVSFTDDNNISDKLKESILETQKDIDYKLQTNRHIYGMVRSFYIDGQLNIAFTYDNANIDKGIQKIQVVSPLMFYFDKTNNKWKYENKKINNWNLVGKGDDAQEYDIEEIVHIDSGIYKENNILSNLDSSIKYANMLRTMEDMLIPMRYSRSVSRRVFNVDVAGLPNSKSKQVLSEIQNKFKYKKSYNVEEGTIKNQQHIASIVEDYWFANRNGAKGTTVDTIDETNNLGEITDILYLQRKLYKTLNVPASRLQDENGETGSFDFTDTNTTRDEIRFFAFISRLASQYLPLHEEILKRELIAKGVMSIEDYDETKKHFSINFRNKNIFYENMTKSQFNDQLEAYRGIEELIGKHFSMEYVRKNILNMDDGMIKLMKEQIAEEIKNGEITNLDDDEF